MQSGRFMPSTGFSSMGRTLPLSRNLLTSSIAQSNVQSFVLANVQAIALAITLAALLLSCPAQADYARGLEAYQNGEFDHAFAEWSHVADSPPDTVEPATRAEAFFGLATLYCNGQGVWQDFAACADWLAQAAELDHVGAQASLGYLHLAGRGVMQSDTEALKWLEPAARQGDTVAQYNLGMLYRDGIEAGEPDPENALVWLRQAAAGGHAASMAMVAEVEREQSVAVHSGPATTEVNAEFQAADATTTDDPAGLPASASPQTIARAEPVAAGAPPSAEPAGASSAKGEEWIRERDPEHYTIQVIALLNLQKLHDFIDSNPDLAPYAIYRRDLEGKPLWVLVQGDYSDVEQARASVRAFPPGLQQRDKMWIRRFAMIQATLP